MRTDWRAYKTATMTTSQNVARPRRILVAGMSEACADQIRGHLSEFEHEIRSVDIDVDLLEQVRAFQPQLVLLDTVLETFDAFGACKRIKQDSVSMVLILTSLNAHDYIERAVESGTDDILSKPLNRLELQKRVVISWSSRIVYDYGMPAGRTKAR